MLITVDLSDDERIVLAQMYRNVEIFYRRANNEYSKAKYKSMKNALKKIMKECSME